MCPCINELKILVELSVEEQLMNRLGPVQATIAMCAILMKVDVLVQGRRNQGGRDPPPTFQMTLKVLFFLRQNALIYFCKCSLRSFNL